MNEPYCFVLMPFGQKKDPNGGASIDFDRIYRSVLVPAIVDAGMHPHRDDAFARGGVVQKGVYEALLLCDYAIADLTIENGNVLYELGVRHAARPSSTLTISARPETIPFDVRNLRTIRYVLNSRNALGPRGGRSLRTNVTEQLNGLRDQVLQKEAFSDSPLFQLIEGWRPTAPGSLKTDLFAERVAYNDQLKERLVAVRSLGKRGGHLRDTAVLRARAFEHELGDFRQAEAGVQVDLMLTYRALEQWESMCQLIARMPKYLAERALVQEQLAFALNRRAGDGGSEEDRDEALVLLKKLEEQGRSSSETFGLMGRVYKDRWRASAKPSDRRRHLADAIEAYLKGFHMDPRDPFPGINAATLLHIKGDDRSMQLVSRLVPVVQYGAERLLKLERPTYWMHATLLEAAVINCDEATARFHLENAERKVRESWEVDTTRANLIDIADAQAARGHGAAWIRAIARELQSLRFA